MYCTCCVAALPRAGQKDVLTRKVKESVRGDKFKPHQKIAHARAYQAWKARQPQTAAAASPVTANEAEAALDEVDAPLAALVRTVMTVAVNKQAVSLVSSFVQLQLANGLAVLSSRNHQRNGVQQFLHAAATLLRRQQDQRLRKAGFFSDMGDGSTDRKTIEQEVIYVRYPTFSGDPTVSLAGLRMQVEYFDLVEVDVSYSADKKSFDANAVLRSTYHTANLERGLASLPSARGATSPRSRTCAGTCRACATRGPGRRAAHSPNPPPAPSTSTFCLPTFHFAAVADAPAAAAEAEKVSLHNSNLTIGPGADQIYPSKGVLELNFSVIASEVSAFYAARSRVLDQPGRKLAYTAHGARAFTSPAWFGSGYEQLYTNTDLKESRPDLPAQIGGSAGAVQHAAVEKVQAQSEQTQVMVQSLVNDAKARAWQEEESRRDFDRRMKEMREELRMRDLAAAEARAKAEGEARAERARLDKEARERQQLLEEKLARESKKTNVAIQKHAESARTVSAALERAVGASMMQMQMQMQTMQIMHFEAHGRPVPPELLKPPRPYEPVIVAGGDSGQFTEEGVEDDALPPSTAAEQGPGSEAAPVTSAVSESDMVDDMADMAETLGQLSGGKKRREDNGSGEEDDEDAHQVKWRLNGDAGLPEDPLDHSLWCWLIRLLIDQGMHQQADKRVLGVEVWSKHERRARRVVGMHGFSDDKPGRRFRQQLVAADTWLMERGGGLLVGDLNRVPCRRFRAGQHTLNAGDAALRRWLGWSCACCGGGLGRRQGFQLVGHDEAATAVTRTRRAGDEPSACIDMVVAVGGEASMWAPAALIWPAGAGHEIAVRPRVPHGAAAAGSRGRRRRGAPHAGHA